MTSARWPSAWVGRRITTLKLAAHDPVRELRWLGTELLGQDRPAPALVKPLRRFCLRVNAQDSGWSRPAGNEHIVYEPSDTAPLSIRDHRQVHYFLTQLTEPAVGERLRDGTGYLVTPPAARPGQDCQCDGDHLPVAFAGGDEPEALPFPRVALDPPGELPAISAFSLYGG